MKILILILLVVSHLTYAGESWWNDFSYVPKNKSYNNINAEAFNKYFTSIEFYSCDNYKIFTKEQCDDIAKYGGKFELEIDYNKDGKNELWNIGIAKNDDDWYPYATVIMVRDAKSLKILQILKIDSTHPHFSIFNKYKESLAVYNCMLCAHHIEIIWDGTTWDFKPAEQLPD